MVSDHAKSKSSPTGDPTSTTLRDEVRVGRLEGLRSLRGVLAAKIEDGPGFKAQDQTAALARQLRDTLAEIAALEKDLPGGSEVDDLRARRDVRRSQVAEGVTLPGGEEGVVGS